jgi:murein DD-endopeptidase MepM/ murein hydrolase activator NlpD
MLWPGGLTLAQEAQPQGPVYIVQQGDTLWDIAVRFGVTWQDLAQTNGITDVGGLKAGDELVIPGLNGVQGVLVTEQVPFGETLRSLSRRYQIPQDAFVRLNRVVSPAELYSGYFLIVPQNSAGSSPGEKVTLTNGQSLLEVALTRGVNPWTLVSNNGLEGTWEVLPGDVLRLPGEGKSDQPGAFPEGIEMLELTPQALVQGDTAEVRLVTSEEVNLTGELGDHTLNFFRDGEKGYVALQGIHAMAEPGLYPLTLVGEMSDGTPIGFTQMVPIGSGDFNYSHLTVPPETVDPANTRPEDQNWIGLAKPVTQERLWDGIFQSPVAQPSPCGFTSYFGERRSYNGSPYNFFHTGLDFCYNYNLETNEIYAPAAGVVVFAGPMTVRGNATMIDHGWGIYTGYMHQEEIRVKKGDRVEAGQVIGVVGGTGRVSGPHLHLEVWVGGVQVDPMDWLEEEFP